MAEAVSLATLMRTRASRCSQGKEIAETTPRYARKLSGAFLKQVEVTEAAAKQTAQSHEWAPATTAIDPIADICFALPSVRFWG